MHNDLYKVEEEFVGGARTLGGDLCFADSNVLDDFRLCERRKKKKKRTRKKGWMTFVMRHRNETKNQAAGMLADMKIVDGSPRLIFSHATRSKTRVCWRPDTTCM